MLFPNTHCPSSWLLNSITDKIEAIKNFPQPRSIENVRSFLGLCGYYRPFISGFAKIASPLNQVTKKGVLFHWDAPQQNNFDALKTALSNAPVLQFPNYAEAFTMLTDASALGLGTVLMQPDQRGKLHTIAYASRTLNQAEKNYSVTHLEVLAVVWALKKFRDIVYSYKITIFTDHAPVTHLFKSKNLQGRLARWFLTIEEFCPEIRHVPGRANVVADSLSRNIAVVANRYPPLGNFSLTDLAKAQGEHDLRRHVIYALESGDESTLPLFPVPFSQFFLFPDKVLCLT